MASWSRCPHCGTTLDPSDTACRHCGAAPPSAVTVVSGEPTAPATPAELEALTTELREALAPRLQLLRALGSGGMGTVFLARDPALKRLVVVKVLSPALAHDPIARGRFAREAESAAAVSHPHVVSVYQVGELPRSGTSYFVMQFVDGPTLQQQFPEGTLVPEARAKRIVGEIAAALAAAHARGLVHRDIKPGNVMLDRDSGRAIVLDFGISAAITPEVRPGDERLTAQGASIGTPLYMSPEQAAGEGATEKSDVYSLGVVAFELLTGRPPFTGKTPLALIAAHLKDVPAPVHTLRPELDPHLAQLIDRCLAKEPTRRPAADEIARQLVPAARSMVEWPPPGMAALQGVGTRVLRATRLAALAGLGFFLVLAFQPTRSVRFGDLNTSSWIWLSLLLVVCLVAILLFYISLYHATKLGEGAVRGRRSGYPMAAMLDVALDGPGDGEALVNGLGAFAQLAEAGRTRLLRLRRAAAIAALGGLALAGVVPLAWTLGWIGGWGTERGTLLSVGGAIAIFLPALAAYVAAAVLSLPERRIRARARRKDPGVTLRRPPLVREELVSGWLAAAGVTRPRPIGRLRARVIDNLLELAPFPLLALIGTMVGILLTTATNEARGPAVRSGVAAWEAALANDSIRPAERTTLDALFAASGTPSLSGAPDTSAARVLAFVALRRWRGHPVLDADTAGWSPTIEALAQERNVADQTRVWAAWRELPGRLPDSTRTALAAYAASPLLPLWRRFARSAPLPPLWYLRRGFPGMEDPQDLWQGDSPLPPRLPIRVGAAAVLATERGDKAGALERAREIVAAGHQLMAVPLPRPRAAGVGLIDVGRRTIAEIGRVTGDRALVQEADRLESALAQLRREAELFTTRRVSMAFASRQAPAGLTHLSDTTLAGMERWALIAGIGLGYCWNPREILVGIDPGRREAFNRARALARDLPRADEWIDLNARMLDRAIADPARAIRGRGLDFRTPLKPLQRLILCSGAT